MPQRPRINTDASYRADLELAGIAYTGSLGERWQVVEAKSTMHAESLALAMAMSDAHARGSYGVIFRVDWEGPAELRPKDVGTHLEGVRALLGEFQEAHPDWKLVRVRRTYNVRANQLARRALKMQIGNRVVQNHCLDAARREGLHKRYAC